MDVKRFFRYLAPNLVTLASLAFGMLSILASLEGRFADAAWYVVFSVLTDKLDGMVARLLKAASEFGVQADSFADFLNFGVAPSTLWYSFLSKQGDLPFGSGRGQGLLLAACFLWVLAVGFRLARYNIVGDDPRRRRVFFGTPTTLMGGMLIAFFLTCLKYGGAEVQAVAQASFDEPRLLGNLEIPRGVWLAWPSIILVGTALMASTVKIPKLGLSRSKALTVFIFGNVFAGYALGFARHFPEYLCFTATTWVVTSLIWGQVSVVGRQLRPPPIFPREDPPAGRMPQRPEEDALPEGDDGEDHDTEGTAPVPRSAG